MEGGGETDWATCPARVVEYGRRVTATVRGLEMLRALH